MRWPFATTLGPRVLVWILPPPLSLPFCSMSVSVFCSAQLPLYSGFPCVSTTSFGFGKLTTVHFECDSSLHVTTNRSCLFERSAFIALLFRKEYSFSDIRRTLRLALMIGLSYAAVSLGVDRLVFGRWTVNQVNFLLFNFFSNGASFYGVQPWYWYLTSGLPSILILHLPLALVGWLFDAMGGWRRLMERCIWLKSRPQTRARVVAKYFGVWIAWTIFAYRHDLLIVYIDFIRNRGF